MRIRVNRIVYRNLHGYRIETTSTGMKLVVSVDVYMIQQNSIRLDACLDAWKVFTSPCYPEETVTLFNIHRQCFPSTLITRNSRDKLIHTIESVCPLFAMYKKTSVFIQVCLHRFSYAYRDFLSQQKSKDFGCLYIWSQSHEFSYRTDILLTKIQEDLW